MKNKLNLYILITVFCLLWSDLFNYLFSGTPLVAWKQLIALSYWIIAYKLANKVWQYDLLNISLVVGGVLFVNSNIMSGIGIETCIFNFFLYFTTPALFVILISSTTPIFLEKKINSIWILFTLFSAIGLLIDLNTDFFSFLPKNEMDSIFYLVNNEVRRASLFFPASTMAVPFIAAGAIYATCIKGSSKGLGVLLAVCLPLAALATGSVSSYFVAFACLVGILISQKINIGSIFAGFIAISVCVGLYVANSGENSVVSKQIDRLFNNTHVNSDANMGRVQYWDDAIKTIGDFNLIDHLVGKGYGVTFPKLEKQIVYQHGESSFFQSHIELGLMGDLARAVPFIFIIFVSIRKKRIDVLLWGGSVLLAIVLAPTAGSIPFQAVVALMLWMISSESHKCVQINNSKAE